MPAPYKSVDIERLTDERLAAAAWLLRRGFPWQTLLPLGYLSLRFYLLARRHALLRSWIGIEETHFWLALEKGSSRVYGIIGLYSKTVDGGECYWLDWFCVDPICRGQGIGSQLLQFSIAQSRQAGKQYLRIITSDDTNESAAQRLYEKHGFYRIPGEQPWYWSLFKIRLICREKFLSK